MKNPWVAGVFSFIFPGIGHLYLGEVKKGIVLMVINIISMLLITVVIGIFMMFLVWIYAILDSIKLAKNNNNLITYKIV